MFIDFGLLRSPYCKIAYLLKSANVTQIIVRLMANFGKVLFIKRSQTFFLFFPRFYVFNVFYIFIWTFITSMQKPSVHSTLLTSHCIVLLSEMCLSTTKCRSRLRCYSHRDQRIPRIRLARHASHSSDASGHATLELAVWLSSTVPDSSSSLPYLRKTELFSRVRGDHYLRWRKWVMFSHLSVCLSVCLSARLSVLKQVINGFW